MLTLIIVHVYTALSVFVGEARLSNVCFEVLQLGIATLLVSLIISAVERTVNQLRIFSLQRHSVVHIINVFLSPLSEVTYKSVEVILNELLLQLSHLGTVESAV